MFNNKLTTRRKLLVNSIALIGCPAVIRPAFSQVPMTGGGKGTPLVVFATWDPSNKSANITLSGGNLVATRAAGVSSPNAVRSTTSYTTEKKYAECTITNSPGTGGTTGLGLCNASFLFTGGGYVGSTNTGIGYYSDGNVYRNNASVGTIATFTSGDVICMAVDATARLAWWRKNGGNWNNNGAADPATGANGIDISAVTGALFAAVEADNVGEILTINFGATAYAQAVPGNYSNW